MSNRRRSAFVPGLILCATLTWLASAAAQAEVDPDITARISREANASSQIMRMLHFFTDVYGPRLTGSPNLKAAGQWAIDTMASWGLVNGHLEPWDFGRPGWANEHLSAHIVSPVKDALVGEALAWTPGTDGTIVAQAFQLDLPDRPTSAQLDRYLDSVKDRVNGKIVLAGKSVIVPVDLNPPAKRLDDERVQQRFDPDRPARRPDRVRRGPSSPAALSARQISRRVDEFLLASGARLRLNDARRGLGQIAAFQNRTYDPERVVPTVVLRNEDYGRIARILADGTPVELEFTILNRAYPEGRTVFNAVAEIEGADKRDEVVMIGAHLDSWHSATGATDNAVGCAIVMEAARILAALDLRPQRTIRVAFWSGEEQGLLGSRAYVQQHFGAAENPKPDFFKLAAYLNFDHGTGRPRGALVFGPPAAEAALREVVAPFADLGMAGARLRRATE